MDASFLLDARTHCEPCSVARAAHRSPTAHLVGIAGSGMRALADVLIGWGWNVTGSDVNTDGVESIVDREKLFRRHHAENVSADAEMVVYSDAVPQDNLELCRARELGIPTLSYFDMLGRLSAERTTTAVAGTHGKSTTTAMLGHILTQAGMSPAVFCGAAPLGKPSGGRAGNERSMLVEACEYRANFLKLRPHRAAVLNIEPDHFDCYPTFDQTLEAFEKFAALVPSNGYLLIQRDCESARRVAAKTACRVESFGMDDRADWSAAVDTAQPPVTENGRIKWGVTSFAVRRFGRPFCEVQLRLPGRHNILNALSAVALAWENGASAQQIASGLASFPGVHRRLELLEPWRGVTMIDDYAHHPTEVSAALSAVRAAFPHARVWCVFQPHQASRTARLLDPLADSLKNADRVLVANIFRAREGDPRPGEVTAADLAQRAAQLGASVVPVHAAEEIVEVLETHLVVGDVLITLGAGDVAKLRPSFF